MNVKRNSRAGFVALSVVLVFAISLASGPLFAHHGSGVSYETRLDKVVTMKGTVKEWVWKNPHCYIIYDVKDSSGKVVEWTAETSSPSSMVGEHGWSRTTLKAGDELTITVLPSLIGAPAGLLYKVVASDGKVLLQDRSRLRSDPTQQ